MEKIYLDHAATTPVYPEVAAKIATIMTENFGNPSSIHAIGRDARKLLDDARGYLAKSVNASSNEIIFTSGGTEADNLAIIGAAKANREKGNHIITSSIEHHAVLRACEHLEKKGFEVTYLAVNEKGLINREDLENAIRNETVLVSIIFGNNEVGVIQQIKELGQILSEKGILFHTDAVQAFGSVAIDVKEMNIDLLSTSAHKINGPKGIGFLYVKDGVKIEQRNFGGEQEKKKRAGTENIPAIVGFHYAALKTFTDFQERISRYQSFKEQLINAFKRENIEFFINGDLEQGLPHILNVSFPNVKSDKLLINLDLSGIYVSTGSACTAGIVEVSHVLKAMFGENSKQAQTSVRFSFGYGNTEEQIERAALEVIRIIKRFQ